MKRKCEACGQEREADAFARADSAKCKECEASPDGLTRLADVLERAEKRDAEYEGRVTQGVTDVLEKLKGGEPKTEKREEENPRIQVFDRFDELEYSRGDFELAMMIFHGAAKMRGPVMLTPPEDFVNAWRYHVFEAGPDDHFDSKPVGKRNYGQRIYLSDADGRPLIRDGKPVAMDPVRAMDTAETGYGLELIGAQYVRDLWEASRNMNGLVQRIRSIPMTDPTVYVPIDGDLPEMLFVGESTSASATAYTTSKTASNQVTLTGRKFTIQQIWSAEMNEDSIIAFTPFLRTQLNRSAALYLGSAYLNGDDTNAGTGNINSDDADPTDTKHYLAWDGIRHYWLVDATGQGKDMAAELDPAEIVRARGKLNAGDDDVDALIKNINWGMNAADLLLVADWDTYMNMLELDVVQTIDKYGEKATIVTGELGRYGGIPIISPSFASKTEADGKASGTETSNTKGQLTLFNPDGFLGGVRRDVQLFFDRIQRTDQFLFELYTRRAFTRFGGNVAAGIYDITV